MANEYAAVSPDQQKALLANSGTANAGLETRRVVATDGGLHVKSSGAFIPVKDFDKVSASYPDGTTEVYVYSLGTTAVGTVTAVYLDTTKGSISTVTKA